MPEIFPALYLSLKVALIATTVNLVLGTLAGYFLARKRFIGRELLDTILMLPMVLPPTVLGYYLLVLLGKQGIIGKWLDDSFGINLIFTWQGAVIAAVVVTFPLITKPARAAFENIAPNLEKMATVFGASRPAAGMARHSRGRAARLCPRAGRIWRHADGGRQHPQRNANTLHRRIRSRASRRRRASKQAGDDYLSGVHRHAAQCNRAGEMETARVDFRLPLRNTTAA